MATSADMMATAIQAIWEEGREEVGRRVGTLDEAVAALRCDKLGDRLRAQAEQDAHKLAGSLGTFGLPRATELARELEQALGAAGGPAPSDAPRLARLVIALRDQVDNRAMMVA